jgi:hypothetical protein
LRKYNRMNFSRSLSMFATCVYTHHHQSRCYTTRRRSSILENSHKSASMTPSSRQMAHCFFFSRCILMTQRTQNRCKHLSRTGYQAMEKQMGQT